MEIITTFKGSLEDIEKYTSIIVAPEQFSIANDYNLTNNQLENLVRICKEKNVKIYVLCNKMMFDEDLEQLEKHLLWIKELDVDGIYFGDLAVYMLAKEMDIVDKLIYGPGMTIVNSEDIKEYVQLGLQAVEVANELTLEEKIMIANNNPNKVGLVINGYLLMSYSKRKVLTNYFDFIEKEVEIKDNFNLSLIERTREGNMPIYEDDNGSYIYSEYVFHSFSYLKQLLAAPFKYFRIDGIFMESSMIEDILNAYNAAILGREDNFLAFIENKYNKYTFDDKFYYTKTSEVK